MAPGKHSADSKYSFDTDYNYTPKNYEQNDNNQEKYEPNYNNQEMYEQDDYEEGFTKKKAIIIGVVIGIIVVIIAIIGFRSKKEETNTTNTLGSTTVSEGLIEKHNGYDVLGKIIIEDLDVEQYILDSTEDAALDNGVIRLYGGSLNNYGNFCIAGHNKSGVFEKLSEMEVGDFFTIVEPDLKETKYKITEIYSAEADDLKCLLQDDEKIEITLITCENASTTRLIVKAEEV
ncbi:MAG: sortase [Clostridia bacterium]|nr:sortase [Clostridia bacterium]